MAEDTAEKEGKNPDLVKKQLMTSRKEWNRINLVTKGRHAGGLNKLVIPDADNPGQRKECHLRNEIKDALLRCNKNEHL